MVRLMPNVCVPAVEWPQGRQAAGDDGNSSACTDDGCLEKLAPIQMCDSGDSTAIAVESFAPSAHETTLLAERPDRQGRAGGHRLPTR